MLFIYCTVCVTVNTNDFHLAIWFRALVIQIKYKLSMIERPMWRFHRKSTVGSINIFLQHKIVGIFFYILFIVDTYEFAMTSQHMYKLFFHKWMHLSVCPASFFYKYVSVQMHSNTSTYLQIDKRYLLTLLIGTRKKKNRRHGMAWHGMPYQFQYQYQFQYLCAKVQTIIAR